jgi:hypothetical protein
MNIFSICITDCAFDRPPGDHYSTGRLEPGWTRLGMGMGMRMEVHETISKQNGPALRSPDVPMFQA